MKFSQALQGFWLEKRRGFSKYTVADYSRTFARFQRYLGEDLEVEQITTNQVRAFLNHLADEEELTPKTVCNVWVALSSFWTWAYAELELPHIIRGKIKQPQVRRRPIEPYSESEVKAMVAAARQFHWKTRKGNQATSKRATALRDVAIIIVLTDTGIRVGELVACTIDDYDGDKGRLTIRHGKGDKQRAVYLGQNSQRALWRYLVSRKGIKDRDPLFATTTDRFLDREAVLKMIKATAKRAGVKQANVHKFRHTFAINFLRNRGSVLELQELLGHERLETVRIYAKLAQIDLESAQKLASPADHWRL
jgi:site-specific recombinase XerD